MKRQIPSKSTDSYHICSNWLRALAHVAATVWFASKPQIFFTRILRSAEQKIQTISTASRFMSNDSQSSVSAQQVVATIKLTVKLLKINVQCQCMLSIYYFDENFLQIEFWSLMTSSLKKMTVLGKSFIAFSLYVVHKNRTDTRLKNKTQLTTAMAGREAKKHTQMGTSSPVMLPFGIKWYQYKSANSPLWKNSD